MGFVRVSVRLFSPARPERSYDVEALVDTGATLSVMPGMVLRELGVQVAGSRNFGAIDGRIITRDVGALSMSVAGEASLVPVPVIFGLSADNVVLGVTALEILGLEVDPVHQSLKASDFLLL